MQSSLKLILLLNLITYSCTPNDQKQEPKSDTIISSADTTQKETLTEQIALQQSPLNSDTLIINRQAAVFYQPDSLQIEKRMKEVGKADFRAGADDYIYYINTSVEYLEKEGLPVLDAKNKKYLKFVLTDKQDQVIKLDT